MNRKQWKPRRIRRFKGKTCGTCVYGLSANEKKFNETLKEKAVDDIKIGCPYTAKVEEDALKDGYWVISRCSGNKHFYKNNEEGETIIRL